MSGFTKVEAVTKWDKTKIHVGDVVAFVEKPYAMALKKYRYYGIITEVTDLRIEITASIEHPKDKPRITTFILSASDADAIEYVLRNGVKPE